MELKLDDNQKKTAIIAAAAAVGVAQTMLLTKYMPAFPATMQTQLAMLGNFGKPAVIAGVATGSLAIILSIFVFKDNAYAHAITAYGGSALISGLLAGL